MKVNRCLIVDTETTGLDGKKDHIIEIGAVLYSVENGGTLIEAGTLLPLPDGVKNIAVDINRITDHLIQEMGSLRTYFQSTIFPLMIKEADIFVAHNAAFDSNFLGIMDPILWSSKPWVCSKSDFTFAKGKPGDSLVNLTLAHGLGVASAHRALTDCQNLARIFDTYTPAERALLFTNALLPRSKYIALTSFNQKELAKARGFQWDGDNKQWWKRMTDAEAADITEFNIRKVVLSVP